MAAVLKGPSQFAPHLHLIDAKKRAALVVNAMVEHHFISDRQKTEALAEISRMRPKTHRLLQEFIADHVVADIRETIALPTREPLNVRTTVRLTEQLSTERHCIKTIQTQPKSANIDFCAFLALAPDGAIRAMMAGPLDYRYSRLNIVRRAHRQPGSAFKPFVYISGLERGLTPESLLFDGPGKPGHWSPSRNDTRKPTFRYLSMKECLAASLNTCAANLIDEVKPSQVIAVARRFGIVSPLPDLPSIAIGTADLAPLELTRAYNVFANGGFLVPTYVIRDLQNPKTRERWKPKLDGPRRVLRPRELTAMNTMLLEVVRVGTSWQAQVKGHMVAGKSGTSSLNMDAVFMGFSSYVTVGVWLGNTRGTSLGDVHGGDIPARIASAFMRDVLREPFRALPGLSNTTAQHSPD
jgi:penicillin-binding protein 1A